MNELYSDCEVIIVPGLDDNISWINWLTQSWERKYQIHPQIHLMPWSGSEVGFSPKLKRFLEKIDSLTKEGKRVSLIGTSAGGSAVLNAFTQRQDSINKVINICGRLRSGIDVFPTLERAGRNSPAFIESIQMFEEEEKSLDYHSRTNVLTIRPLLDEVVPLSTMTLDGAVNVQIISIEHMISITAAMTIYSHYLIEHLLATDSEKTQISGSN